MGNKNSKLINAKQTRQNLLDATLPLFIKHGFDGTGVNQILKQANLSKGAFYHHFTSKSEIYEETISEFFLSHLKQLDLALLANMPLKQIRKTLNIYYSNLPNSISDNSNIDIATFLAAFFEALRRLPEFKKQVNAHYSALIELISEKTNNEHEIFPKVASAHARKIISNLEGKILLDILTSDEN